MQEIDFLIQCWNNKHPKNRIGLLLGIHEAIELGIFKHGLIDEEENLLLVALRQMKISLEEIREFYLWDIGK